MKEELSKLNVKVGIFVALGLMILAVTTILLGEDSEFFVSDYPLRVRFKYVQGLREGSIVSLAGLKAGNIKKMKFVDSANLVELTLGVYKEYKPRFRQGSVAEIRTQGALGDKYIFIEPGPVTEPVLEEGALIKSDEGNDIITLISEKGDDVDRFFDVLKEIQILLKRINENDRSGKIMANFEKSSQEMTSLIKEAKKLTLDIRGNMPENKEFKKSISRLASVLKKLDQGDGTLGALINDPTLHQRINELLGGKPRHQHMKSLIRKSIEKARQDGD